MKHDIQYTEYMTHVSVLKSDGNVERFSAHKVRRAIARAGIPTALTDQVLSHVRSGLYSNIPTHEIHSAIVEFLSDSYPQGVVKFNLKLAIMKLGPSGFPFERYVAELLKHYGYETEVDAYLLGHCVRHEVDVLAIKDSRTYFVECKYHNHSGIRSDIKTALYVFARGEDLQEERNGDVQKYEPWLFTNTKFTGDAINYAQCRSMRLTGWGYPEKGNLQDMIEEKKCYPITALSTLSLTHIQRLLKDNIVMVHDLERNPDTLLHLDMSYINRHEVQNEIKLLIS